MYGAPPPLPPYGGPPPPGPAYGAPPPAYPGAMPPPMGAPPPYAPGGPAPFGAAQFQPAVADPSARNKKIFLGVGIGAAVLLLGAVLIQNAFPAKVEAPTLTTTFSPPNHQFTVLQPDGWDAKTADSLPGDNSADASDVGGVLFRKGSASIDITTDSANKSKSAQLLVGSGDGSDALTNGDAQLAFFDRHCKSQVSGGYRGYKEGPAYKFELPGWGDGVSHTFTADGPALGFGGPVKGYRVSVFGWTYTARIVCACRPSDWDTLKGPFQQVINSLKAGH